MIGLFNVRLLFTNFLSLGFVQILTSLSQLLVVPYMVSKTGVENYGVVVVAQVVMIYLSTFVDYGFNQTATREVSLNRNNHRLLSQVFSRVLYTKLFLCVASFAFILLLSLVLPFIRHHFLLYCMAFIYVPGASSMPVWFLQGMEKMRWMALACLLSRILFVALVFLLIKNAGHADLCIFLLGGTSLLAGVITNVIVFRKYKLQLVSTSLRDIYGSLKEGWQVVASNLSMNIIQYGNLFILRIFTNDLAAGYYGVAERVFFSVKQLLVAFSQAVYPRICALASGGAEQVEIFVRKLFIPFFLLIVAGSIMLALMAPYIIEFFLQEANPTSVFILQMFCIVLPVVCLNIPGSLALLAYNRKKQYFMIYGSAVIISLFANLVLASEYRETGTIAAILITELVITVMAMVTLGRLLKNKLVVAT
ncbi:MAG: oligosaccharide flippase family protein [Chitinophagaceae bacterium]|nr:oligosaccharide flippase family protein [Chitinophagaceae bacterium]